MPTRCPVCALEQRQFEQIDRHIDQFQARTWSYTIHQCNRCRSQFAWPREAAPPEWYAERGEYYGWRWEFDLFLNDMNSIRDSEFQTEPVRILEVGCGEGLLLASLASYGDAWGLESNRQAAAIGRTKGLRIVEGDIDGFLERHSTISFRIVGCFQILEHVERPRDFLSRIRQLLSPGGWLFLSVPNPDRYMLHFERERWDFPPHHLTRFSKGGLMSLLEQTGFRVLKAIPRPMAASDIEVVLNKMYHAVPWPRRVRQCLKFGIRALSYPIAIWMRWASKGQDLYLAAKRVG
jgi:2-polyprenyl-3-methyl-5-hydroxy-6-metoxy-1,4-benzoquinol methylase